MLYDGVVHVVDTVTLRSFLTAAAATSATTLTVEDAVDFNEDGGTLLLEGTEFAYTVADLENDVITLAAPLPSSYAVDAEVTVYPVVTERQAAVVLEDDTEAMTVRVPHALYEKLPEGIREPWAREGVVVEDQAGELVIADVLGNEPTIDGSFLDPTVPLDPAIVPAAEPAPVVAPTLSPTPTARGGLRSVLVDLPPVFNESAIQAEVYVGTVSPVTVDAAHLHGVAEGTQYQFYDLPDGTALVDLPEGTVVYVVVRAVNSAGAAAASAESSTTLRKADVEDFSALYLYAGEVQVDQLRGGAFQLGEGTVDTVEAVGVNGEKVGMSIVDGRGFYSYGKPEVAGEQGPVRVWFPVDGKPNIVSGQSEFDDMTVNRTATLNGVTTVTPGSKIVLGVGVQPPKAAPSVIPNWHTVQHTGAAVGAAGWTYAGLTKGHDGFWYSIGNADGTRSEVDKFGDTTGTGSFVAYLETGYTYIGGIVYSAATGRYYVLGQRLSGFDAGDWFIQTYDNTFTQQTAAAYQLDVSSTSKQPALGWDHVNSRVLLVFTSFDGTGTSIRSWSEPASAASPLTGIASWFVNDPYNFGLGYVGRVSTEYGDRFVFRRVASASSSDFRVFTTAATPVQQTAEQWPMASNGNCNGAWFDGTRFWSLNGASARMRYETGRAMWTSGSATREVESTLWAGNRTIQATRTSGSAVLTSAGLFLPGDAGKTISGTGIPAGATVLSYQSASQVTLSVAATSGAPTTGSVTIARTTYETTPSPKTSVIMPKRSRLTVTVGAVPLGANSDTDAIGARVYVGVGSGVANASMVREKTVVSPGTAWSLDSTVAAETGVPPTVNGFPASTPSDIESSIGGVLIKADGGGDIGTAALRDSVRAAVNGSYAEAWTAYTPTFTAATTNPTLGSFTRSGRFIQRGKTVSFSIVLTATAASGYGTGTYEFGLPVTARSADEVTGQAWQTSPNQPYIAGRSFSVNPNTVSLYLTDLRQGMSAGNSAMANGTTVRISGTYEAA